MFGWKAFYFDLWVRFLMIHSFQQVHSILLFLDNRTQVSQSLQGWFAAPASQSKRCHFYKKSGLTKHFICSLHQKPDSPKKPKRAFNLIRLRLHFSNSFFFHLTERLTFSSEVSIQKVHTLGARFDLKLFSFDPCSKNLIFRTFQNVLFILIQSKIQTFFFVVITALFFSSTSQGKNLSLKICFQFQKIRPVAFRTVLRCQEELVNDWSWSWALLIP